MKRYFPILFAALGGLPCSVPAGELLSAENPASAGAARTAYLEGQAFLANDIVPLSQARKDWSWGYDPRDAKDRGFISARIETGVQWRGFRLGYLSRSEWWAEANRDSLDVIRANRQNANYEDGRNYSLNYHLRGFAADGVRLTKSSSNDLGSGWTLAWGAAVSALHGRIVRSEDVAGSATGTGGRTYTATVDWTLDYSHTDTQAQGFAAPYRDGSPSGQGYSTDFGINLTREDGLRLEWVATDAFGRMRWSDIPETTLSGTNLAGADLPGGHKWRVNLTQSLPVRQALALTLPTAIGDLKVADTYFQSTHLPRIGVNRRINPDWAAQIDYDVRFSTLGLGVSYRRLNMNLRSDALNLNKARAFGLGIGARMDF